MSAVTRRMPAGAEVQPGGGVHFRVWAPERARVEVLIEDGDAVPLQPDGEGWFAGLADGVGADAGYRFRLDGEGAYPDPASRFQPEGPHGPSQVVDPGAFRWSDGDWKGAPLHGQVIYEMHVGTFTAAGTWAAAAEELAELAALGVTCVEVMPVSDFPGRFGWGYDGVDLFAPTRLYGTPDDFRRFVDRAHACGIAVVLDVVYNHLGPDGNFLRPFSPHYFSTKHTTEWGDAMNFDGPHSGPVREFFTSNARYWIREFHVDGLRLDATQSIFDESPRHVLAELAAAVREEAGARPALLIAENEPQHARLVRPPERGGIGLDALWNDDYHHSAIVALTGRNEAYYADYLGTPQELVSSIRWGYLYQGQHYRWQEKRRGAPSLDVEAARFVLYLQNHDQVANSGRGERIHALASPGRFRAMTALTLLAPGTPMLFQGQEFASSAPFLFFADHEPALAEKVREGRREFLGQFPSLSGREAQDSFDDPADPATFARCKLDFAEREAHAWAYLLHRDLLRLRREDAVFSAQRADRVHGAVLGDEAFLLRFFGHEGDDRLLLVNLGRDLELSPAPEPLLAPPEDARWRVLWASEEVRYGGAGIVPPEAGDGRWRLTGHAAVVLSPAPAPPAPPSDGDP